MQKARIFRPDKTAMQSGLKKTRRWLLEFAPAQAPKVENLMGWTGQTDMPQQTRLSFPTMEAAVAYAQAERLEYEVILPHKRSQVIKPYADNFQYKRPLGQTEHP